MKIGIDLDDTLMKYPEEGNMNDLYILGDNGQVYTFNGSIEEHYQFSEKETMMGATFFKDKLMFCGKQTIYGFDSLIGTPSSFKFPIIKDFHQIQSVGEHLYITCTKTNQIMTVSDVMILISLINVAPPVPYQSVKYKQNYNHINNVFYYEKEEKWYVNLNRLNNNQKQGKSGYAVFNKHFTQEITRIEYGWESHGFCFIDDKPHCLVGSSLTVDPRYHPNVGGLLVDGELVWTHNDNWFCKDFSVTDKYIYVVGTTKTIRANRKHADGVLFVLDRKTYTLLEWHVSEGLGGFCGCLSCPIDYTKNK
tara:strand:- start:10884 stop:11804 length:921 start_codon:yes stop_codon:yes gene_type:complete